MREISSCCCLTTAGKTRQLLLNKIDIPFLPSLYIGRSGAALRKQDRIELYVIPMSEMEKKVIAVAIQFASSANKPFRMRKKQEKTPERMLKSLLI